MARLKITEKQKRFLKEYLEDRQKKYGVELIYEFDTLSEGINKDMNKSYYIADILHSIKRYDGHILLDKTEFRAAQQKAREIGEMFYDISDFTIKEDVFSIASLVSIEDRHIGNTSWMLKEEEDELGRPMHFMVATPGDTELYMSHYDTVGSHNLVNPVVNIYEDFGRTAYMYADGNVFLI